MKFTLLYFIGILNIVLGYGVTKWLLREQVSTAESVTVENDPSEEISADVSESQPSESQPIVTTTESAAATDPEVSAETVGETSENLPVAAAAEGEVAQMDDPTQLDKKSVKKKSESAGERSTVSDALGLLENELSGQNAYLQLQLNVLKSKEIAADELEHLSQEIDVAMQRVLKTVNRAIDAVAGSTDSIQDGTQVAQRLEDYWSDLNGDAIQLITLVHSDENREATQAQLQQVVTRLMATCIEAQEMLMNRQK